MFRRVLRSCAWLVAAGSISGGVAMAGGRGNDGDSGRGMGRQPMPMSATPGDNGASMRGAPMSANGVPGSMMAMPEGRRGDSRSQQMMVMPNAPRVAPGGGKPSVSTTPVSVGGSKPTFSPTPVGGMSPASARPTVSQPAFDAPAAPQPRVVANDRPTFTPTVSSQAQPMPVGRPNVPTAARPAVAQTPTYTQPQMQTYSRPVARENSDALQFSRVDSADRRGYGVSDSRSAALNADRRPFQNHKPEAVHYEREPRHSSTSVSVGFSYNSFNYYPASTFSTSVYYSNACSPVTYSTVYYGPAYYSCAPVYYAAPACFTPVYYAPTCYTPVYYAPVVYQPVVYYTPAVVVQPAPMPVYTPAPCGSSFFSFGISFGTRF